MLVLSVPYLCMLGSAIVFVVFWNEKIVPRILDYLLRKGIL
jgi:hypothetical protein